MFNDRNVPTVLKIINTLGLLLMLTINALANILPINGYLTGDVSDRYPNLFTPAAITFSIWGVIYAFLILFWLYHFDLVGKKSDKKIVERIGWLFFISCLLNSAWIVLWHYLQIQWTMVVMLGLLIVLLRILYVVHGNPFSDPNNGLFVIVPFSLYAGWITVATIANATALLVHWGWSGWGISESTWAVLLMAVATLLMSLVVWRYKNWVYGLVLIWTLAGIWWKHKEVFSMEYPLVAYGALVLAGVMAAVLVGMIWNKGKAQKNWF